MLQAGVPYSSILREMTRNPVVGRSQNLVQKHRPVKGVSLNGLETGISDHLPRLLLSRCICSSSKEDAADIVGTESQANLHDLQTLRLQV